MANPDKIVPHIIKWEGGLVNDPMDAGGLTNKGVTYRVWCEHFGRDEMERFKRMDEADWKAIYLKGFWQPMRCEEMPQAIADIVAEFGWMSGHNAAITTLQRAINSVQGEPGLKEDGQIGRFTLAALNKAKPELIATAMIAERRRFYVAIIARRPQNARFRNGWNNRLNALATYLKENYQI
jgi:lysozyme family protein